VFVDLGDNEEIVVTGEADKDNQLKTCNNHQDNEKNLVGEKISAKEQDEETFQCMEECMMMLTTI
jgi:hypothetical protein